MTQSILKQTQVEDLVDDLAAKQGTLVSGTSIKTVNGNSLLGSGDITITTGGEGGISLPIAITDVTSLQTSLDSKQSTLVSGTNIKTVNGTSLLGSGNIAISGSGGVASFNTRTGAVSLTSDDVIKTFTSSSATKDIIWNSSISGAADAGDGGSLYIQRNASYTGGTFGNVNSALYIDTFTPTGTHNPFEWGLTSVLWSRSIVSGGGEGAAPQNVAINGSAFRTAGNAPIWAGNFPAYHISGTYGSGSGEMHGIETSVGGNGADPGESTIGLYVLPQLRSEVDGPGYFQAWTGILVANGTGGASYFRNGITNQAGSVFGYIDRGSHSVALDLSTSTNSISAIRIKANDHIDFEGTSQMRMKYNSSNGFLEFYGNGTRRGYLNLSSGGDGDLLGTAANMVTTNTSQTITALKTFTGGVDLNGLIVRTGIAMDTAATIQWNGAMTSVTAGSGFASLPANPVGFVKISIDGTERKIPYYV